MSFKPHMTVVGPYHVYVYPTDFGRGLGLYIVMPGYAQKPDRLLRTGEDGSMTYEELVEGAILPKPTIEIPRQAAPQIIEALQDALGIKPPDESLMQGRMDAMALHLADMRRLVFEDMDDGKTKS